MSSATAPRFKSRMTTVSGPEAPKDDGDADVEFLLVCARKWRFGLDHETAVANAGALFGSESGEKFDIAQE